MSMIAHAQYYGIERKGHPRTCLPCGYGAEIRRGCAVLEAMEAGGSGTIFQQPVAHQAFVARGILRANPALIGQGEADAAPIERLGAQDLEQSHGRSAA